MKFWAEEGVAWKILYSGKGNYCLNRTRPGRKYLGKSECEWTLSPGMDCYGSLCTPYNCRRYQGRWNQTHVKLRDSTWVRCSFHEPWHAGCRAAAREVGKRGGFKDSLYLACQRDNTTSKKHVIRVYQWAWQNSNGTRTYFTKFWSATNRTTKERGCNCKWHPDAEAFECDYCDSYGDLSISGGPLGSEDPLYYEAPQDDETWDGPFANGAWALEGHYWICGQRAYRRLPPNWSGICYVGYIMPFFFLLSDAQADGLGVQLYDELRRKKRSAIEVGGTQKWGQDKWAPQRIIETYGPATWAQDGSWGYRTPVYMLSRIIRLQAVLEVITRQPQ
uniref:Uncharacterized protein n=1 Tax=Calidris pygmaea TaxID=425635 RepID=A0A8C3PLP7_9CHAR